MTTQGNLSSKKAFTTFEVAEICDVTPVTIQNWIDKNWLQAYRTPGGHRRVLREDLLSFLESRKMPHILEGKAGPPCILIVDDEKDITELIQDVLLLDNPLYKIEIAHDGFRAGVLCANLKPDVVLLDLMLPGIDGFEVCRQIKQSARGSEISVIAITGYDDPEYKKRILQLGATHYLQKPIDLGKVKELVKEAVSKRAENPATP
ncbi:MAG: response regulator [bacterium]|nr:response regulator [bacterium]